MASLAGAMFYLHNEIVWHVPRRFNKTRLQKFKVTTRATQPLIDKKMNFGTRVAFDRGMCTGPFDCDKEWNIYGYYVGCNKAGSFPTAQWGKTCRYPGAVWYSFPGSCPSAEFNSHTNECILTEPGGHCPPGVEPTGAGDCTYQYELVGEISLDELDGIGSYTSFIAKGGREYNKWLDRGLQNNFWNKKYDEKACKARIKAAEALFKTKYPDVELDEDLPAPECDFNYWRFYH